MHNGVIPGHHASPGGRAHAAQAPPGGRQQPSAPSPVELQPRHGPAVGRSAPAQHAQSLPGASAHSADIEHDCLGPVQRVTMGKDETWDS